MKLVNATYSNVRIETPENIAFTYEIAGPATRMIAYLIDFIILILVMGTFNWVFGTIAERGYRHSSSNAILVFLGISNLILIGLGGFNLFFEYLMKGQSPGKSAMGIRVIQDNGCAAGFQALVVRNVFRLIDCCAPFQYAIGAIAMVFTPNTQRFGDLMAGTLVVKDRSDSFSSKYRWKMGKSRTVFKQDVHLSREEFDYLMEYIDLFRNFPINQRNKISMKLATVIIKNHQLQLNENFTGLVQELNSQANLVLNPPHQRAEAIFKLLLEFYSAQNPGANTK